MSAVRLRRVAAEVAEALRRLAARRHRSSPGRALRLITVRTGRSSSWSREEIYGPDAR